MSTHTSTRFAFTPQAPKPSAVRRNALETLRGRARNGQPPSQLRDLARWCKAPVADVLGELLALEEAGEVQRAGSRGWEARCAG
jgi:hypothetical protein